MTDISPIATPQARPGTGGASQSAVFGNGLAGNGAGNGFGLNFFDLIFGRIGTETVQTVQTSTVEQTGKKAEKSETNITLLQTPISAPLNLPPDDQNNDIALPDDGMIADTLLRLTPDNALLRALPDEEAVETLRRVFDTLLSGMPDDDKPVLLRVAPGQMKKLDLADDSATPALIAVGLSPRELNELIQDIANNTEGENNQIIGLIRILPADSSGQERAVFIPRAFGMAIKSALPQSKIEQDETAQDGSDIEIIAGLLNGLNTGGEQAAPETTDTQAQRPAAPTSPLPAQTPAAPAEGDTLPRAPRTIIPGTAPDAPDMTASNTPAKQPQPGPGNSTLPPGFKAMLGSLSNDTALSSLFPEGTDWANAQQGGLSNAIVNGPAQLSSLVTQVKQAGQPHPAAQAVAITISRAAQGGENRNMTVHLDPPELGRIEIQMHFTKDKSVKAHMIFEKPETMLMLQRDSQALERALAESGVDAGSDGLSFELAAHDHGFDDGRGGNQGGAGGQQRDDGDAPVIIESTMNWYVDSETGLQRYDLLA